MHSSRRHRRRDRDRDRDDPSSTGIYVDPTSPSNRLTRAIVAHDVPLVRRLLATAINPDGSRLDSRNPDPVSRRTSLMVAAEGGNLEMCRMLIEDYGVEQHGVSKDIEGNTVLHIAASHDFIEIAALYQANFPSVIDWPNADGVTALHIAAQHGYEVMVTQLLDGGADVELTDSDGNTALHYASGWGHLRVVLILIERDCPFWAKNNVGFTASDHAFSFSLQSTLQEAGRAHYEAKKQQKRQRHREREREKEKAPVAGRSQSSQIVGTNGARRPGGEAGVVASGSEDGLYTPAEGGPPAPSRSASLPLVGRLAQVSTPTTPTGGAPTISPSPSVSQLSPSSRQIAPTIRTSSSFNAGSAGSSEGGGSGGGASRIFPAAASRLIPFSLTPSRRGSRSRADSGASSLFGGPPSPSHSGLPSPTSQTPAPPALGRLRPAGPGVLGKDGRNRAESTSSEQSSLTSTSTTGSARSGSGVGVSGRSTPLGLAVEGRDREGSGSGSGSGRERSPAGKKADLLEPSPSITLPGGLPIVEGL